MRARVSSAIPMTTGDVRRRKLVFHKRSVDGSAKADAAHSDVSTDCVWGVVYRIDRGQKPVLDAHEFLGVGYDELQVDVVANDRLLRDPPIQSIVKAWMYVARHESIDSTLLPYRWYLDFIVRGARQHRLPADHVACLKNVSAIVDPNEGRRSANRQIILGR